MKQVDIYRRRPNQICRVQLKKTHIPRPHRADNKCSQIQSAMTLTAWFQLALNFLNVGHKKHSSDFGSGRAKIRGCLKNPPLKEALFAFVQNAKQVDVNRRSHEQYQRRTSL